MMEFCVNEYRADPCGRDYGPEPLIADIACAARQNRDFRTAFWTGKHLQMTLMAIPVCGEIGAEVHTDTEQLLRVECGQAMICMGCRKDALDERRHLSAGDAAFVPCGVWHNVLNTGSVPLKLSSIYAPPHHPHGTVHSTRAAAKKH